MRYTVKTNMQIGLLIPIIIAVLLFCLSCFASRRLAKKWNSYTSLIPLLLWGACFYSILISCGKGFIYPIRYFLNSGVPEKVSIGQISQINSGPDFPIYFDPETSTFCNGQYVVVNGCTYFYPGNSLRLNQWVELRYIDEEKVICTWDSLSEAEGRSTQVTGEALSVISSPATEMSPQISSKIITAIWYISFSVFVLVLVLQQVLAKQIALIVQQRDTHYVNGIFPSFVGLILYGAYLLPLSGMIACWRYNGFDEVTIVGVIAGIIMIALILYKHSICATFNKKQLVVKRLGKIKTYDVSSIRSAEWRSTAVPFCHRLVITLCDHSQLVFEQEHFWGLSHMRKEICEACLDFGRCTDTARF